MKTDDPSRVQAALILSTFSALHTSVNDQILAAPLLSIHYNEKDRKLSFPHHDGMAVLESEDTISVSALDSIIACHLRDVPLILEGETGCGKTITTETYLEALLPQESSVFISLGHQSFTDSPKSPFEKTELEQGMPVTHPDWDSMRRVAAEYVDELNLGNPKDLLQLSHGRIITSRGRGTAGILIPTYEKKAGVRFDDTRIKRLWVAGSQNPPRTRDAQFSGQELTASMKNRFLVLQFPKIMHSAGSTMWLAEKKGNPHEEFLDEFRNHYRRITKVEAPLNLAEDWLSLYAFAYDPESTEKAIIQSSLEFGDALMSVFTPDIPAWYSCEKQVAKANSQYLPVNVAKSYRIPSNLDLTQEVQKIQEVSGLFTKPLTERDNAAVKNLADLLSTVRGIKRAFTTDDPLESYLSDSQYITLVDVAAAGTLLARNKQMDGKADPLKVVNATIVAYTTLVDKLASRLGIKGYAGFDITDTKTGLRHFIYTGALRDSSTADEMVIGMAHDLEELSKVTPNDAISRMITARVVSDIGTAAHFLLGNRRSIDAHFKKDTDPESRRQYIRSIYTETKQNPVMPQIYAHRLPRVI